MKKFILALMMITGAYAGAQTVNGDTQRQINVNGEGTIMVAPDEAIVTIGVNNTGKDAAEVKKANDAATDKILKYLKSIKLHEKDYQTQRVYLNRNYDYDTKKYSFSASQTIKIHLRDLSKYDSMMAGLTDAGVNTVDGVEFRSSKQEELESQARVKAVADAKKKAEEYARALNVAVGFPLVVTDNTQTNYPRPVYAMKMESMAGDARETLAAGEIEVKANVNITFELTK